MKVRVENAESRRMKNENEEEGERECRKRKKGKKGKREALRRLINGPWRRKGGQ